MNIYFTITIPFESEVVGQSVRASGLKRRFDVDVPVATDGKVILPPQ